EVVRIEDRPLESSRERLHRRVEDPPFIRMLRAVRPNVDTVEVLEGRFAGADAVFETAPGPPVCLTSDEEGPAAEAVWNVAAKKGAGRRQLEAAVSLFFEHAERGERAQKPIESAGVRAARFCELVALA